MNRIKATISYDGTNFAGYQIQPGIRTVQQEIDKALTKIHKGENMISYASGRTDAGVHANGQVIHFDTPFNLPLDRWKKALNVLLPTDIRINKVESVDQDFHARYSATGKTYRYKWSYSEVHSPFERNFSVPLGTRKPNVEKMREAAMHLMGTHDFSSFCSTKTATSNKVRTVKLLTLEEQDEFLVMTINGDGFLYNMVRTIAGVLIDVGVGRKAPSDVLSILEKKDRKTAGKTLSAQGLYLENVEYKSYDNPS
ncbi:tRNA pseudouridine(38-40) synthase TruA [Sporosarcina siberiensis]|uniref:tRNA pseudouridine synthase A n=1 Tax=Sporosarcina siberiensis TaxID=1365606 RepID=A0ABW4SLB6_9BACL